jgi:purine-binding chemotaxis protein CheW
VHPSLLTRRSRRGSTASAEQFLLFRVGGETYGLGIEGLWEVMPPEGITGLPTAAHQVCSALAYRGHRLPLVRLAELFGVPADRVPASAQVLLLDAPGRTLGILVDEVLDLLEVPAARITPMPRLATTLAPRLFRGLCGREERAVILLRAEGLGELPDVVRFDGQ